MYGQGEAGQHAALAAIVSGRGILLSVEFLNPLKSGMIR